MGIVSARQLHAESKPPQEISPWLIFLESAKGVASPDDILEAARHRLRGWTDAQVDAGIEAIASQAGMHTDNVTPAISWDGRDPFSATCALLVLLANARGDAALLYRAGYGVIESYRQAQRATWKRRSDALTKLIAGYIAEMPGIGPKRLWEDFKGQARDGFSETLVDFSEEDGILSFVPWPGAEIEDIGFQAFRKKVQRVRATFAGSCRSGALF